MTYDVNTPEKAVQEKIKQKLSKMLSLRFIAFALDTRNE